ncbi:MAG: type IX secretion system sortase PorU [Flavisolibacter sp.]
MAPAQRTYPAASVLATGNWYKLSVSESGVFKIDLPFLSRLGISGSIPSSQIRLFGNGGSMLPEDNAVPRPQDLVENAIWVEDGGDGVLDGSDYILFYAPGPDRWLADSVNRTFTHQKNLFSNKAFYYLTIGGSGLRVGTAPAVSPSGPVVNTFDERYFHESDTINFLNSGKEWFGEEFSNLPGRGLSRSFDLPLSDLVAGPASIRTALVARSIGTPSAFNVAVNGNPVQSPAIPAVSANQYDLFAQKAVNRSVFPLSANTARVQISYQPGGFNSQGWLDHFEFFCRRSLIVPSSGQLSFRDWSSVGQPFVQFRVGSTRAATRVWDVTDPLHPEQVTTFDNGQTQFTADARRLREYIAFYDFLTPTAEDAVANQNLHGGAEADYLIVSHPLFMPAAEKIAAFHRQRSGLRVAVVTTEQVFNEFSSGSPDPTAIRDFVKMYYDRFRAAWQGGNKYLLLLGKGSFDYKNRLDNNANLVPVYETQNSLDPLATYTSDDFFGFLDDDENINDNSRLNTLDVGIGRVPATTVGEAEAFAAKHFDYHDPQAFGAWRNDMDFVADDEDQNLHLQDAEVLTATVRQTAPDFNIQKIYLDAYRQESGSAGGRYPQVKAAINSHINAGTLIWNYSGHGGPDRLAEEAILDQEMVNNWKNRYRLPLFITATCDFAPYDNPYLHSLGEDLLVRPAGGAIALMTTSRVVFAYSNRIINDNYLRLALQRDSAGHYKTLGESLRQAKNYTYQASGDISNNRKFSLLGDPAMALAFPRLQVALTAINGKAPAQADTLAATSSVQLQGEVRDENGDIQGNFNGMATVAVYDKLRTVRTLGNDAGSLPLDIPVQDVLLFRGKATVIGGKFSLQFKLPKDMNYSGGTGKISLYAENGSADGNGAVPVFLGGLATSTVNDKEGPEIKAFLNDENFVNGGLVNPAPLLIVNLFDTSGINTSGLGIGHDLEATLDDDNRQYFTLNNFYESATDDFSRGQVRFQLPALEPGEHSLTIRAWDAMNNSADYKLFFTVAGSESLSLRYVLNYPNPFTTRTAFWFEHNRPGEPLQVKIEIFTVTGKLINPLTQTINNAGNRSGDIEWNGEDDYGRRIGRGVYLYRLRVTAVDGKTAEKWEKLVILN